MISKTYKEINEQYFEDQLDSGLKVVLLPRKKFNRRHAILSVDVGSVDLKLKDNNNNIYEYPEGIAHFMEHILFENREGSIIDEFSELGSSVNAYTGFNNTNYYFNTTSNFYKSLNNLFGFVLHPQFDTKRINHEKGVIKQEINMYQDSPNWQAFFQLLQSLFFKYPIKYNIAGSNKSIEQIGKDLLIDFYDKYYNLNNMTLVVIGDIDPDNLFNWLSNNLKNDKKDLDYQKIYPQEPTGIGLLKKDIAMSISRPIISIGYKENRVSIPKKEVIKQDLLSNMTLEMIFGKSNDNYHKLYNQNYIDENFSFNYMREKNTGFAKIYAETNSIDDTSSAITSIIDNWESQIKKENFEIVKHKYIGRYFRSLNSFDTLSSQIIKYLNLDQSYLELLGIIKRVELEDIVDQYKNLLKEKEHVEIIIKKIKR